MRAEVMKDVCRLAQGRSLEGGAKPVLLVIAGPNGCGTTTVTYVSGTSTGAKGSSTNSDEVARDRFGEGNSPALRA